MHTPREEQERTELRKVYGDRVLDRPGRDIQIGDTVLARSIDLGQTSGVVLKCGAEDVLVRERYRASPTGSWFTHEITIRRTSIVHGVRKET
jgi:molybdopterin biosynthesis enzyme